jgi:hypothetical protein
MILIVFIRSKLIIEIYQKHFNHFQLFLFYEKEKDLINVQFRLNDDDNDDTKEKK